MLQLLCTFLVSLNLSLLCLLSSPSSLVVLLLAETVLIVCYMVSTGMFFWLGYVLILLLWGSMMVLFLYCACLSPNPFKLSLAELPLLTGGFWVILIFATKAELSYFSDSLSGAPASLENCDEFSVTLGLTCVETVALFIYSVSNLLLVLLIVCEVANSNKGSLVLMK